MNTATIIAIAVGAVVVLLLIAVVARAASRTAGVTNIVVSRRASFARRPEAVDPSRKCARLG